MGNCRTGLFDISRGQLQLLGLLPLSLKHVCRCQYTETSNFDSIIMPELFFRVWTASWILASTVTCFLFDQLQRNAFAPTCDKYRLILVLRETSQHRL